jgi:hypothetical protein
LNNGTQEKSQLEAANGKELLGQEALDKLADAAAEAHVEGPEALQGNTAARAQRGNAKNGPTSVASSATASGIEAASLLSSLVLFCYFAIL